MHSKVKTHKVPLSRLLQIRRVFKKYGLGSLLANIELSGKARLFSKLAFGSKKMQGSRGEQIRKALEELGPVFVKFGQAISTRPDLLPDDIALELTKLQDQVPAFPDEQAMEIVKQVYGDEFDAIFSSFTPKPLGSASVAQVHTATLVDGSEVVVKILRPNIAEVIEQDLDVLYKFAELAEKHWSQGPRLRPLEVVAEYDNTIHGELDMRREAANACQMRANFEDSDLIYVPEIYWDYTHENVLVMERINGIPIRDIDKLVAAGIDLKRLSYEGVEIFFKQAFEDNFFHADMHPGNIFVSEQGQYRAVDFGIMGTLTDEDKHYLAENFLGFFNRDYKAVADAHLRAGWVPKHTKAADFEAAIRTVCEPIFAKPISEISFGKLLIQLFQTARRFEMPIQPQLVLLQKTLLNIEGLGRQLYPNLDLWDTAKPFLENWMREQIGVKAFANKVKKELPNWGKLLPELPAMAESYLTELNKLRVATERQNELIEQRKAQFKQAEQTRFHKFLGYVIATSAAGLLFLNEIGRINLPYPELICGSLFIAGIGWVITKGFLK